MTKSDRGGRPQAGFYVEVIADAAERSGLFEASQLDRILAGLREAVSYEWCLDTDGLLEFREAVLAEVAAREFEDRFDAVDQDTMRASVLDVLERILGADVPSGLAAQPTSRNIATANWLLTISGPTASTLVQAQAHWLEALVLAGRYRFGEAVSVVTDSRCAEFLTDSTRTSCLGRGLLASWLAESGQVAAAVEEFRRLLDDQLRVLGADHPDTLNTRHNLAHWRGQAGTRPAPRPPSSTCSPTGCGSSAPTTPTP